MENFSKLSNEELDLKRIEFTKCITSIDKEKARRKLRIEKNMSCLRGKYFRKSDLHGTQVLRILDIREDGREGILSADRILYSCWSDKGDNWNHAPYMCVSSMDIDILRFAQEYDEITKEEFIREKSLVLSYGEELEEKEVR